MFDPTKAAAAAETEQLTLNSQQSTQYGAVTFVSDNVYTLSTLLISYFRYLFECKLLPFYVSENLWTLSIVMDTRYWI